MQPSAGAVLVDRQLSRKPGVFVSGPAIGSVIALYSAWRRFKAALFADAFF